MSVCFVLSGGASLGAIQVGMLRALYERGVAPDAIVGTSVGAVNGAFIASRPPVPETADELAEIWRGLRRQQVFPYNPATALIGLTGRRNYMVPNGPLRRLITEQLQFERLEESPVAFHVVAVDLFTGRERRLSRGPALDAVLASAAIPGVFPTVDWEDTELIDGGVANNTPISHALELGFDRIYILPTGAACDLPAPPRGALGMAVHAMSQLVHLRLTSDVAALAGDPRIVVLHPPCPISVQPTDFSHADALIRDGYDEACRALDDRRRTCAATPAWPRPVSASPAA